LHHYLDPPIVSDNSPRSPRGTNRVIGSSKSSAQAEMDRLPLMTTETIVFGRWAIQFNS